MAQFDPPSDLSGGYVVLSYSNGTDSHRQRIHVRAFTKGEGTNVYTYSTPNSGSGAETTVAATLAAYLQFVKVLYNSTWTWRLDSLWKRTGTNTFVQQFPIPTVVPVAGTGTVEVTGIQRCQETILNFSTSAGRRMRMVYVAESQNVVTTPNFVSANGSGNNTEKLVDYLTDNVTGIVAHDNSQPVSPAHVTYPYNRRLRRSYGFA